MAKAPGRRFPVGEPSFLFSNCCELQRRSPFCSGESMEELEWDSGSVAPCIDLLARVGLAGRTPSLSFTSAPQPRAGACEGSSTRGPGRGRDCSIGSDPCPKQGAPSLSRVQRERSWLLPGGQGSTARPLHKLQPLFFLCAGNLCP